MHTCRQITHCAMGTVMVHTAFGLRAEEGLAAVCGEVSRIETLLSCFRPGSDISRANQSAGTQCEAVSPDTYEVLSEAVAFSRAAPGCFDVTVRPLVALWARAAESSAQPDESSIRQLLPLVNYQDLVLGQREMTAGLTNARQAVDLGGIGKGFAGDKILDLYRDCGVCSAYSNLGGNVVTVGAKPDGSPWSIGIQHPRQENGLLGTVCAVNQAVVTSGDYQRCFFGSRGKRYHHILDPASGYPSESGLISVTIVARSSLTADALSTMVFVAGMEKGLELLGEFPQTDAVLVDSGLHVHITPGLEHRFQAEKGIAVSVVHLPERKQSV